MLGPWRNSKETVVWDMSSPDEHLRVRFNPHFQAVPATRVQTREWSPQSAGVFVGVGLTRSLRPGQEAESWGRSEQHS